MIEEETLVWDVTRSDTLALLTYFPLLRDRSTLIGSASSLDGNGVSFDVLPPTEFLAYFGTAPQPRPAMGPAVGTGAALVNWTSDNALYIDQQKGRAELRKLVLNTVPKHLLVPMQDADRSMRLRSVEYIITTLRTQLGTLTKADLDFLMREVGEPYHPSTSVSFFLAKWEASLRDLERAGQGLPQTMATDILQKCFGPDFNPCWVTFVQEFPLVANRTVERLCKAIITFARDSLPLLATHSVIGISTVTIQADMIAKMQAQIDQLEFQPLVVKIDNHKQGRAAGADRQAKQRRTKQRRAKQRRAKQQQQQAKQIVQGKPIHALKSPKSKRHNPVVANADSGATGNYLNRYECIARCVYIRAQRSDLSCSGEWHLTQIDASWNFGCSRTRSYDGLHFPAAQGIAFIRFTTCQCRIICYILR